MQASGASFPAPFPPPKICILGAGQFGRLAAQRLSRRYPEAAFLVVDERRERLEGITREVGLPVLAEALQTFLDNPWISEPTWIVPAIPVQFAFEWVMHELQKRGRCERLPVPEGVAEQIPNPYRAAGGSLCASFATFICPDSCNEPDELCTHTGKPRPGNLFEVLAKVEVPGFEVIVVRSWQLAPGVGGYPYASLGAVLQQITATPKGCSLLATSCRCHGVMDALSWERTQKGYTR